MRLSFYDQELPEDTVSYSNTILEWHLPTQDGGSQFQEEMERPIFDSEVNKIGVLISTNLDGTIFSLPALNALRLSYPGVEIVAIGQKWQKTFFDGRPGPINRFEVLPESYENGGPLDPTRAAHLRSFIEEMRGERFDILLQMKDGGHCSNPFVKQLGSKLTAGLRLPDAPPLDRWIPYSYNQLAILRNLEVVSLVGAEPISLEPQLVVTEEDITQVERVFQKSDRPLAVIYPGAADPRTRWPAEKFAAIADTLALNGGEVVLVGSRNEEFLVQAVIDSMHTQAVNLCGKLSVSGIAGLVSEAQVTIANDSGILQLANACGTPTVGIYWCGRLLTNGPVTQTRHRTAISWEMHCPTCGLDCTRSDCGHLDSFVSSITKDEVAGVALEFLRTQRQMQAPPKQNEFRTYIMQVEGEVDLPQQTDRAEEEANKGCPVPEIDVDLTVFPKDDPVR